MMTDLAEDRLEFGPFVSASGCSGHRLKTPPAISGSPSVCTLPA